MNYKYDPSFGLNLAKYSKDELDHKDTPLPYPAQDEVDNNIRRGRQQRRSALAEIILASQGACTSLAASSFAVHPSEAEVYCPGIAPEMKN
ncbi:hypothetical protein JTB14_038109 [Gonioctena quinquepunctata]|nr:hypothetical protein JTB14_038109 [Gonioctena quinquepunctata]